MWAGASSAALALNRRKGLVKIDDLMAQSGVKFGTSGARGRVADMSDRVCFAYTRGFLQYLLRTGRLVVGGDVGIAGDHRSSSPRIMRACAAAVASMGCRPRNFGAIPTPALAAYGIARGMPTLMVTGSHIPDDRNGIKFNLPTGEILKDDEAAIRAETVDLADADFSEAGGLVAAPPLPPVQTEAAEAYVGRYLDFFPPDTLAGLRIGLYEHSSVARDAFHAVLTGLGAEVVRLGRAGIFIPVDTEAIRPEDVILAEEWAAGGGFDALVSADGDGDRPLVADARGQWLRGDIAGILCARELGAVGVVTPVSSNTAVERCGWFDAVLRTRIGSPYVIAGMQSLCARGIAPVVGYEANGGFLIQSDIRRDGRLLPALPTRDAVIVAVGILAAARRRGLPVAALTGELPARYTYSDRIKNFPTELSRDRLRHFATGDSGADRVAVATVFAPAFGAVAGVDHTDGVRITFTSGEVAHLRPSGNAPELRAYTEADSPERAREMNAICMRILDGWRD
jgi:phosphomannomutase